MTLSKQRLQNMKEAELRVDVLIPLFKAMGFQGVDHYHGGAGEQGKDIVMWFPTPLRDREYCAVVVKAGSITGQAQGKGSAAEVFMQVNQALGSTFTDKELTTRRVAKCWVVSSHDIKKEARDALKSALGNRADDGLVRLVDGDELWDLVQEHTPAKALADQLHRAGSVLEELSPHHRVTATLREGRVHIGVEPKHDNAHLAEPLDMEFRFAFPSGNAYAQAVAHEMDAHIRLGTPVTIPGEFIQKFETPKALEPFIGDSITVLQFGPRRSKKVVRASLVAESATGEERCLTGLEFRLLRGGTDELEISNAHQSDMAFSFTVTSNRVTKRAVFRPTFRGRSTNARIESETGHFFDLLHRGGALCLRPDDTGANMLRIEVPPGVIQPINAQWLAFVDMVAFVQQRTGIRIPLPKEEISSEDAQDIAELAAMLREGIYERKIATVSITIKPGRAEAVLESLDSQRPIRIVARREEWLEIFGVTIPLGEVVRAATQMRVNRESAVAALAAPSDHPFELELEPANDDSKAVIASRRWLTDAQFEELKGRLPEVDFETPLQDNTGTPSG